MNTTNSAENSLQTSLQRYEELAEQWQNVLHGNIIPEARHKSIDSVVALVKHYKHQASVIRKILDV